MHYSCRDSETAAFTTIRIPNRAATPPDQRDSPKSEPKPTPSSGRCRCPVRPATPRPAHRRRSRWTNAAASPRRARRRGRSTAPTARYAASRTAGTGAAAGRPASAAYPSAAGTPAKPPAPKAHPPASAPPAHYPAAAAAG
ncbi:hypothetical protein G6F57_017985 [Rhizopus arrhizus]|nr:hypothetical protein G6F57_017985 [Rhizopus arrhizus]